MDYVVSLVIMASAALALLQYLNAHNRNIFDESIQTLRSAFNDLLPKLDEVFQPGDNDSEEVKGIRETYDNLVNQKLGGMGNKVGLILIAVLCFLMVANLSGHAAKVLVTSSFAYWVLVAVVVLRAVDYVVLCLNAILAVMVVLTAIQLWKNAVQVKTHEKNVAEAIGSAKKLIGIARAAADATTVRERRKASVISPLR